MLQLTEAIGPGVADGADAGAGPALCPLVLQALIPKVKMKVVKTKREMLLFLLGFVLGA